MSKILLQIALAELFSEIENQGFRIAIIGSEEFQGCDHEQTIQYIEISEGDV